MLVQSSCGVAGSTGDRGALGECLDGVACRRGTAAGLRATLRRALQPDLPNRGRDKAPVGAACTARPRTGDDEPGMPAWGPTCRASRRARSWRSGTRAVGARRLGLCCYIAFGHWKIACISEGVFSRVRAGVIGDGDVDMGLARTPRGGASRKGAPNPAGALSAGLPAKGGLPWQSE